MDPLGPSAEHEIRPSPAGGETVPAPVLPRLLRDRVFQLGILGLAAVLIPYLFPSFSEDQQWWWENIWVNLILHTTATLAAWVGMQRIRSARERTFWGFLTLTMGTMVVVYLAWAISESIAVYLAASRGMELFSQACYLAFYLFVALALDGIGRPEGDSLSRQLRLVRAAGLGIMLAGLLAYFAVVPVLLHPENPVAWTPILLAYASLDLALCLQAFRVRAKTEAARARNMLGWLGLVMGSYAFVDFAEAADYAGWFDTTTLAGILELQWYVPIALFVVGARIHHTGPIGEEQEPEDDRTLLGGGPLIFFAAALPLVHFVLYATDLLDPELRGLRESVVLGVLLLVGGLAFLYQRKVEELNRVSHEELQASRERYSSFVDTSVEGIWLMEFEPPIPVSAPPEEQVAEIYRRGLIVESNDTMATMHGFDDSSQIQNLPLRELFRGVKNSERNARATLRFVTSGYRAIRETITLVGSDGEFQFFEGSMVGVVEDNALVRAWATQVDVTPRYRAEAEKEKLEQQLRRSQRLETIGTLAGGIAHDFNNILAPILGFADLAEDSVAPNDAETRECLGQIKTAANRAKELVGQILAVGQRRDNVREPVHFGEVIDDALELLRQSLPSTVRLQTRHSPDCPPALADPAQLHQVVMNLCTNSAQAMSGAQGTVRLEVSSETIETPREGWEIRPGRYVVLTVSDDGKGMSEEILNRAFEPFYTTKEVGQGSGLGLSVTHGIVRGHGGHIELESEQGVGTKIRIYLPATNGSAPSGDVGQEEAASAVGPDELPGERSGGRPAVGPPSDRAPERDGPAPGGGEAERRVMLVDDESSVARTCEAMLRRMGFSVSTYTDSAAAKEALEAEPRGFDLLLTDHTMPDVTGPELAEVARKGNPSIAVVIASGHRFGDDSAPEGGVVRLEKPFTVAELKASVDEALGRDR